MDGRVEVDGKESVKSKNQSFGKRLRFALRGLRETWRREASFRTQTKAALGLVLTLVLLQATAVWWAACLLSSGLVLVTETLNTVFETQLDLLHPARHEAVMRCKDAAAGAVLLASLIALGVFVAFLSTVHLPWLKEG